MSPQSAFENWPLHSVSDRLGLLRSVLSEKWYLHLLFAATFDFCEQKDCLQYTVFKSF